MPWQLLRGEQDVVQWFLGFWVSFVPLFTRLAFLRKLAGKPIVFMWKTMGFLWISPSSNPVICEQKYFFLSEMSDALI